MDNNYSRLRKNKEKTKKRKIFSKIFYFILILLVCYGGYTAYNFYNSVSTGYNKVNNTVSADPDFKKFSILIMGIDENESRKAAGQTRENSRTDAMIYMAVNKDRKRMDMVSIPRDSLTLMNDGTNNYFFDKITHAHVYNKEEGTIEAVSNLLNVPINFYAVINFAAFEDVINSLGGVELYVPFDMIEQNSNGEQGTVHLKQGWHTLNGEEALAFARSRYYDSDIERGQRQLQVIHSVIDKAKSLNAISKINDLIKIGGDNVTHNMTPTQIVSATTMFLKDNIEIVSHRIGGYDAEMNGVYYYYPKPSHLLYVSSVINDLLGTGIPKADDLVNIKYQGYIVPLQKQYVKNKKTASFSATNLVRVNYFNLTVDDYLENIPDQLTDMDLKNDPTVSNENKPEDSNNNTNNNN